MKRKFVAPLIALLLCVSMIGVGFAGWVITASTKADVTGNFTVYSVSDHRLSFTATAGDIIFGKPVSPTDFDSPWLSYPTSESFKADNFQPTITLTFTDLDLTKFAGKTITFTVGFITYADTSNIKDAVDNQYITIKTSATGTPSGASFKVNSAGTGLEGGATLGTDNAGNETFTFQLPAGYIGWGNATNYTNPYNYFNALDVEASYPDLANKFDEMNNGDAAFKILDEMYNIKESNEQFSAVITCTIS